MAGVRPVVIVVLMTGAQWSGTRKLAGDARRQSPIDTSDATAAAAAAAAAEDDDDVISRARMTFTILGVRLSYRCRTIGTAQGVAGAVMWRRFDAFSLCVCTVARLTAVSTRDEFFQSVVCTGTDSQTHNDQETNQEKKQEKTRYKTKIDPRSPLFVSVCVNANNCGIRSRAHCGRADNLPSYPPENHNH